MPRDHGITGRLLAAGLAVVEIDGWQDRGSSDFHPRGAVCHHTAGSSAGSAPSLNTVIHGRADLPGPLCHVLQSRESNGDDVAFVVAAGRANHAGEGGWHGLEGNSSVWGLEIEHTGTAPLPWHRQNTAARILAALVNGTADAGMVCQHREWAPGRKIDTAEDVDPDRFRDMVAEALIWNAPDPEEEDDVARFPIDLPCPIGLATPDPAGRTPFWRLTGPDGGIQAWNGAPFYGSVPQYDPGRRNCIGLLARQDRPGYVITVDEGDPGTATSPTFAFP